MTSSRWDHDRSLLVTELHGSVDVDDVRSWIEGLHEAVGRLPDGTRFRMLLDLTGYEPASLEAHKEMRTVVPELLADHGLRPAFLELFPEEPSPELRTDRDVVCVAFANVHHDETKMTAYEERIATAEQRFFTSRAAAEEWVSGAAGGSVPAASRGSRPPGR